MDYEQIVSASAMHQGDVVPPKAMPISLSDSPQGFFACSVTLFFVAP